MLCRENEFDLYHLQIPQLSMKKHVAESMRTVILDIAIFSFALSRKIRLNSTQARVSCTCSICKGSLVNNRWIEGRRDVTYLVKSILDVPMIECPWETRSADQHVC